MQCISEVTVEPCKNGAECTPLADAFTYECTGCDNSLYSGENCDITNYCPVLADNCKNGAVCNDDVSTSAMIDGVEYTGFSCECTEDYFGTFCSIVKPCTLDPCQFNGTISGQCIDSEVDEGVYTCNCFDLFTGEWCQNMYPCESDPCKFESTCTNVDDFTDFACECQDHYSTKDCGVLDQCNVDSVYPQFSAFISTCGTTSVNGGDCTSLETINNNPLVLPVNGVMVEIPVFEFSCECYTGFEGDTCENDVPCELLPCQNGATCSHVFGSSYQCLNCPANYTGLNCDVLIPCSVDPCARGTCSNTDDFLDFECECPEFYVGETCADIGMCTFRDYLLVAAGQAVYDSYEDTCRNNGVCTNSNTTADVSLPFILDGQFVQITTSDFTCECAPGFTGAVCDTSERAHTERRASKNLGRSSGGNRRLASSFHPYGNNGQPIKPARGTYKGPRADARG